MYIIRPLKKLYSISVWFNVCKMLNYYIYIIKKNYSYTNNMCLFYFTLSVNCTPITEISTNKLPKYM